MSDIQIFSNDSFGEMRVLLTEGGEPMFAAVDVCKALDLSNPSMAVASLDDDERAKLNLGRQGETNFVTEPGFYKLVMRSRKPEAKAFQRWITHEVLPELRRRGSYEVPKTRSQRIAAALAESNAIIIELDSENRALRAENEVLRPKAMFADAVSASDGTILVGEMAKMLRQSGTNIGQKRFFALLREDGYLGKSGSNYNVPTQYAMELELFRIKETAVTHSDGHVTISRTPKVTGKGQAYFMKRYGHGKLLACA